jgi:hypothetical protein
MKLTDKAQIEFRKWFFEIICRDIKRGVPKALKYLVFMSQSDSEKYGVYVDWFDSVNIDVEIFKLIDSDTYGTLTIEPSVGRIYGYMISGLHNEDEYETRPQARAAAIHKANEIFNNLK